MSRAVFFWGGGKWKPPYNRDVFFLTLEYIHLVVNVGGLKLFFLGNLINKTSHDGSMGMVYLPT